MKILIFKFNKVSFILDDDGWSNVKCFRWIHYWLIMWIYFWISLYTQFSSGLKMQKATTISKFVSKMDRYTWERCSFTVNESRRGEIFEIGWSLIRLSCFTSRLSPVIGSKLYNSGFGRTYNDRRENWNVKWMSLKRFHAVPRVWNVAVHAVFDLFSRFEKATSDQWNIYTLIKNYLHRILATITFPIGQFTNFENWLLNSTDKCNNSIRSSKFGNNLGKSLTAKLSLKNILFFNED